MRRRGRQLGSLVALAVFCTSAWAQTEHYAVPAVTVGEDFSAHHQALDYAADAALARVTPSAKMSGQIADPAVNSAALPDSGILHKFAQQYWNGDDEAVRRAVARVTQLWPVLVPVLREEGVPDAVAALVLIESAGSANALSSKGARGVWQFMPDTARRYGLLVTGEYDERLDVPKATHAAARYLRDLYSQFGNWPLAFAAYNAGAELVERASLTAHSKDFALLSGRGLIPAETRRYVPAVIAASNLLVRNTPLGRGSSARELPSSSAVLYAGSVGQSAVRSHRIHDPNGDFLRSYTVSTRQGSATSAPRITRQHSTTGDNQSNQ